MLLQSFILEPLNQAFDSKILAKVLEEDFDEDAGAGGGVGFSESDDGQTRPVDGLCVQHMPEELGTVPHLVHFELVHILVLLRKHLVEERRIQVWVD